jgi:hypothetical protein
MGDNDYIRTMKIHNSSALLQIYVFLFHAQAVHLYFSRNQTVYELNHAVSNLDLTPPFRY